MVNSFCYFDAECGRFVQTISTFFTKMFFRSPTWRFFAVFGASAPPQNTNRQAPENIRSLKFKARPANREGNTRIARPGPFAAFDVLELGS